MSDEQISKVTRERSPSFPFISLKMAIERLHEFEMKFGRNPPPADRTYIAWGYKGDTSQAQQTLAALKSFGMVEYSGSGPKRSVSISDDARTYLRANQDSIKSSITRKFALTPTWFARMWEQWGANRHPDEVCLDDLVLKYKFNERTAPVFLRVYDETIAYADLGDSDKIIEDDPDGETVLEFHIGDTVNWEAGGEIQWKQPRRIIGIDERDDGQFFYQVEGLGELAGQKGWIPVEQAVQHHPTPDGARKPFAPPPVEIDPAGKGGDQLDVSVTEKEREEKLTLDEGRVVLVWPKSLSAESVEDFEYWIKGIIRRAKRQAGVKGEKEDDIFN